MSHVNIGRLQVLWWPRPCLAFRRGRCYAYRWIVYLWPFEYRWFATGPLRRADEQERSE